MTKESIALRQAAAELERLAVALRAKADRLDGATRVVKKAKKPARKVRPVKKASAKAARKPTKKKAAAHKIENVRARYAKPAAR